MLDSKDSWSLVGAFTLVLGVGLIGGCGSDKSSNGCVTDDDCRGDRVCSNGICLAAPDDTGSQDTSVDTGEPTDDTGLPLPDTFVPPPDTSVDSGTDTGFPIDTWTPPDTGVPADTRDIGPVPDVPYPDAGTVGPQIEIVPANELDFGTITVASSVKEKLIVKNVGDATLKLVKTGLKSTPSSGFSVSGPSAPQSISPGGSRTYNVTFDPQQQSRYQNAFVVDSNDRDPSDRHKEVDLRGSAFNKVPQPCLFSTPDSLDYGVVQPGNSKTRSVTIGNCSVSSDVTVTSYNFLSNPSSMFSIASSSPTPPFKMSANQTKQVDITYSPTSKRSVRGELSIRSDETTGGGDFVDLIGSGGGCAEADAQGHVPSESHDLLRDGPIAVKPSKSVELDGTESSSPSGKINYQWSITSQPSGSSVSLSSTTAAKPTLSPSKAGVYEVKLEVTNPANGKQGCVNDTIEIVSLANKPDLQVTTTWQADHNMDVHVVRSKSSGLFPNFRDQTNGLYPEQPALDWGTSGTRTDDAFLLGDSNAGSTSTQSGGERAFITNLESGRKYRIALHFRDADGFRPARFNATTKIKVLGSPNTTKTLMHRFTIRDRNKFWISFEVDGSGNVTNIDMER